MLIRKYIIWSLGLLVVAGLVLGSSGSVLCIAVDGRVKIESICQPCFFVKADCCFLAATAKAHDHQDDCDDCQDLSLGGPTWLRKNFNSANSPNHIASPSSPSFSPCLDNNSSKFSRFAAADSFRGHDRLVLLLSTTVLIC